MHPRGSNRLLKWAGFGLSLIAVIFLLDKFKQYSAEIDYLQIVPLTLPLIGLSIAFAAANLSLALAWRQLLSHLGSSVSSHWAVKVYGVSQLAKYVPGNIFHFVGRQVLGVHAGLSPGMLAKSAVWEIALLAITGSITIFLILPYFVADSVSRFSAVLFVLLVFFGLWLTNRFFTRKLAQAAAWQMVYQYASGLIFLVLLLSITPVAGTDMMLVIGAYVVAWWAGFITPGSPAGIGIREVILLALLKPVVNEADLLLAISLSRIITVSGDFLFYLCASALIRD